MLPSSSKTTSSGPHAGLNCTPSSFASCISSSEAGIMSQSSSDTVFIAVSSLGYCMFCNLSATLATSMATFPPPITMTCLLIFVPLPILFSLRKSRASIHLSAFLIPVDRLFDVPIPMNTASYLSSRSLNITSLPTLVLNMNSTPSDAMLLTSLSMASLGRRYKGGPMSMVPPPAGSASNTVISWPLNLRKYASDKPDGPAPIIATLLPVGLLTFCSTASL